jgi:hypothetical protein
MQNSIVEIILEWTQEGYLYLYEEQPNNMKQLEKYLGSLKEYAGIIYRRTDYKILEAKIGDILKIERVTSWSANSTIPDAMYEGVESVMLILDGWIIGQCIADISFFKEEEEFMLAPCKLKVIDRQGDILYVQYFD